MAQRDQGMRMLISNEEDEEDDEDDEDEEGEDEDENEDDDPLPVGNLLSGGGGGGGGLGRGPGGDRTWACQGGVYSNWKVSGFPMVLVPAYSLLKQEQLQLAHLAFVTCKAHPLLNIVAANPFLLSFICSCTGAVPCRSFPAWANQRSKICNATYQSNTRMQVCSPEPTTNAVEFRSASGNQNK